MSQIDDTLTGLLIGSNHAMLSDDLREARDLCKHHPGLHEGDVLSNLHVILDRLMTVAEEAEDRLQRQARTIAKWEASSKQGSLFWSAWRFLRP